MCGVRGRSMIQLHPGVVGWMVRSFLSSPYCHSPQENGEWENVGEWDPTMVHKFGPPREFSALQKHRAVLDRQWSHQLPSSPGNAYGFPSHSSASAAPSLPPGHSPASQTAPGGAHKLPGFRSHTQATL